MNYTYYYNCDIKLIFFSMGAPLVISIESAYSFVWGHRVFGLIYPKLTMNDMISCYKLTMNDIIS